VKNVTYMAVDDERKSWTTTAESYSFFPTPLSPPLICLNGMVFVYNKQLPTILSTHAFESVARKVPDVICILDATREKRTESHCVHGK